MEEKTCQLCGQVMVFDAFTNAWVCSSCGNSISDKEESSVVSNEVNQITESTKSDKIEVNKQTESAISSVSSPSKEEMLIKARAAMREAKYEQAVTILSELRKKRFYFAQTYILMMLCGYQVNSTTELLSKISQNASALRKLGERADWQDLTSALRADQRKYVSYVIEYCAIEIVLSGNTKIVFKNPKKANAVSPSAFAKMDAEEEHIKERVESLKQARRAESGQDIVDNLFDIADVLADLTGEISEPLFSDPYYSSSDVIWESAEDAYFASSEKTDEFVKKLRGQKAPSPLVTFVSVKSKLEREDLLARKAELLGLIADLESQILST